MRIFVRCLLHGLAELAGLHSALVLVPFAAMAAAVCAYLLTRTGA